MTTIKGLGGLTSPIIEANWRKVQQLIKDSDMPNPTVTPATDASATVPKAPKNVCTIHVMFPVEEITDAVSVAQAIQAATKNIPDAIHDFRVSDSRIAPRRMNPNG